MEGDLIPVQGWLLKSFCFFSSSSHILKPYLLNFRLKDILLSSTWHIKGLPAETQRKMQSLSEFFSRMAISLDVHNHMQKIWDFMVKGLAA